MSDKREYVAGEDDPEAAAYVEGQLPPEPEDDGDTGTDDGVEAGAAEDEPEEKLARAGGWCPKEEWRGDPAKWVDAKTFNDTASPARMRDRVVRMEEDRAKERDEYNRKLERIERMSTVAIDRLKKEHEDNLKSLRQQREENVLLEAEANGAEAAKRLQAQWDAYIADQEKNRPEVPEPAQTQPQQPVMDEEQRKAYDAGRAWASKHAWAQADSQSFDRATFTYAHAEMARISEEPAFVGDYAKQFAELDKRLAKRFPEYYPQDTARPGNGQRQPAAPPANARQMDGVRITTKREGSYSSRLNEVERRMGRRFVERGDFPSLEAYAKDLHENG